MEKKKLIVIIIIVKFKINIQLSSIMSRIIFKIVYKLLCNQFVIFQFLCQITVLQKILYWTKYSGNTSTKCKYVT